MSRLNEPDADAPAPALIARAAVALPASPVGPRMNRPLPLRMVTRSPPRSNAALLKATLTTRVLSPGVVTLPSTPPPVRCSKSKSPLNVWPPTVNVAPTPETRRYRPTGNTSGADRLPAVTVWFTAAGIVLMARE